MPEYPTFNAAMYRGYIQNLVQRRFFPRRLMEVDDQFIVGFVPRPQEVAELFAAFPSTSPGEDSVQEFEHRLARARERGLESSQVVFLFHDVYIHMAVQCFPYEEDPDFLVELYEQDVSEADFVAILDWVNSRGEGRLYDVSLGH